MPFAVRLRIPINEFYDSTPIKIARRVPFYLEARNQAEKEKEDYINVAGWVNGLYVCRAIATMSKRQYLKEPIDIFESRDERTEDGGSPADGFRAWAIVYNDQRRRSNMYKSEVIGNAEH